MEGVSEVVAFDLTTAEDRIISAGPLVLTSFVVCEKSGAAMAAAVIAGAGEEGPYFWLRLNPGQTLAFADRIAAPWGLLVRYQVGDLSISVAYQ